MSNLPWRITRRELLAVAIGALGFVLFMCSVPFDERSDQPDSVRTTNGQKPSQRINVRTNTVQNSPAVLLIAGDIARCNGTGDETTALVLDSLVGVHPDAIVVPLGDLAYEDGTAADFANCFHPSWGRHKARMLAVMGNHERDSDLTATPYFDYFNGVGNADGPAGPRGQGYYSWNPHPAWHVVTLNTNSAMTPTKAGSVQGNWLLADLEAATHVCVLALFHHPRFYSTSSASLPALSGYTLYPWQLLTQFKADLNLVASQHFYERFAPQLADGAASADGMRQIVAGTGGASGAPPFVTIRPNSEVRNPNARGVLKLELGDGFYQWEFVSVAGRTFTDSGQEPCHGVPVSEPPDTTPPDTTPTDTTPPPPPPLSISLAVTIDQRTSTTTTYAALDWTGASGTSVDVYRDGVLISVQANDGHYVNSRTYTGPTTYVYKICEAGSAVCSNEASVTFN